jgi:hypothetical protein
MNYIWLFWHALFVCLTGLPLAAQPAPSDVLGGPSPRRVERRPDRPPAFGPWNRDLLIQRSTDGLNFGEPKPFVERAGVPCLTADTKGRLVAVFQWFPFDNPRAFDRIGTSFSEDGGRTWTPPRTVAFSNLPAENEQQFDPTVVTLPDGRLRLYFTSPAIGEHPAIYSAISSDGLLYTFEPRPRFAVEEENVVDCSVGKLGDTWHLFAPVPRQSGRGYHAESKDGLNFERKPDVTASVRGNWIGNVVPAEDGLRFYGSGPDGVWSATSSDGATWKEDVGGQVKGGDPSVWRSKDGDYVMVVTGGLRADAPMDPPWRREGPALAGPGGAGNPRELPPRGFGDFGGPLPGSGSVTANERYVYVLKDNVVYQFDAQSLQFIRQAPLPEPAGHEARPMRPRGPRALERRESRPPEP